MTIYSIKYIVNINDVIVGIAEENMESIVDQFEKISGNRKVPSEVHKLVNEAIKSKTNLRIKYGEYDYVSMIRVKVMDNNFINKKQ